MIYEYMGFHNIRIYKFMDLVQNTFDISR